MSYGMDGWNHDNDLVRRKDVMDSIVREYNRSRTGDGLKLAWIEKAVNEVDVAQQGKIQLPEEDATKGATSDLISRAAAIDELNKGAWGVEWDKTLAKTMIESLPSAQFTQNTRVNSNNALDTISREAALEALDEINAEVEDGYGFDYAKWRVHFRVLPSAQPERVRGKWIYGEDEYGIDGYHCDKCGFFVPWDYAHNFINYIEDYNFCPNCGADMREAKQ